MRPSLKTAMRSLIVSASSWSWVTKTKVMPTSRWICLELDLHLAAQLEVEGAERLVEQQHLGPVDQGAGQRDALPLAAGELVRPARRRTPRAGRVASASSARLRRSALATFLTRRPYSTFCSTLMCGKIA